MIIGPGKYSKDPNLIPEGIMLTLPVKFFEERKMTTEQFKKVFERIMAKEDSYWNFKLTNLPTRDVCYVYLLFDKQVQYRCNLVGYERNQSKSFKDAPDGKIRHFPNQNWVVFAGPVVKPPFEWNQKGFQGFRYTTKLF
jgi:hypothetical protein